MTATTGGHEPTSTKAAVVVVTHNTCDETLGCLATLPAAGATEVVVVDSGSTDGTAAAVHARYPHTRVVELGNVGFGRAANTGIRATSAAVVVVCNADVRFQPSAVARLAAAVVADDTVAAAGPSVVYPDGSQQASARRVPDLRTAVWHALLGRIVPTNRWTAHYRHLDTDPAQPRDADWLSGCTLALRRDAVVEVGGFDPGYFLYVEDVDLDERLRTAGWRLRYEPTATVSHRVGASSSRQRLRSLVAHARSLDRYHRHRSGDTVSGRLARPFVWIGLAGWVVVTWLAERLGGRGRSATGERIA